MLAELLDGALYIAPTPGFCHQDAVLNLALTLRERCQPGLRVLVAPFTVRLTADTQVSPDVLVARYHDLTTDGLAASPLLVAEVCTAGSGVVERSVKRSVYARHGIPSYWLVDPEAPSIAVFELGEHGGYLPVAVALGEQRLHAERPFPITLAPADLVVGLQPD